MEDAKTRITLHSRDMLYIVHELKTAPTTRTRKLYFQDLGEG